MLIATLLSGSAAFGWVLLAVALVLSVRPGPPGEISQLNRWGWWALLAGALVAFRWPLITLPHELYPDESQLLAGALTLRHDPMFWRSVDGGTAGPLDYYALLPAAFFSGTAGYAAARLTAALIIWGMLVAAGETLALVTSRTAARVAVLPALAFEALTTSPEFIHYSTELVPGLLLAAAVFAGVRQSLQPARGNLWAAALLLGAVPFAKLQAGPIAAALGLLLVMQEVVAGRPRNSGLLIGVALLPALLVAGLVTATDQAENMLIPYLLQNMQYTQIGRLPLREVVYQFGEQSVTNGYHALWLAGSAVVCFGAMFLLRDTPGRLRACAGAAAGLLAVTVFCILSPGRPYHHYLNLLTLPVMLLAGVALGLALQVGAGSEHPRSSLALGGFLLCTLLPQLALRASPRPDPFEYYNTVVSARGPAHRELVARIRTLAAPGEPLGIWGWRCSLYVETGQPQATRQAQSIFQWLTGPWQNYYLRRYYEDLVAARPPVFADAAGPGNFWFDKRIMGHEVFPLLRDWVQTNYRYVAEVDGVRIYSRADRAPVNPPGEISR